MTKRLQLRTVNKKCLESLVLSGGLDRFEGVHRAQYFAPSGSYETFIDHARKIGESFQSGGIENQASLFGEEDVEIKLPEYPNAAPWPLIVKLTKEKEITGIYMSGHPLDDYRLEVENFTNCPLDMVEKYTDRRLKVAGIVTDAQHRISKRGTGWGIFTLQDFRGSLELKLFSEDYLKYKELLQPGEALYLEGFYQRRYEGADYDFSVKDIKMLATVSDIMTESITLRMSIEQVSEEVIANIDKVCKAHKGAHKLKLQLYDPDDGVFLNLVSKAYRVRANADFANAISEIGVKYKLN